MSTKSLEQTTSKIEKNESKHLILYNDDVNTFDHVIDVLIRYCDHTEIQAEQCAVLVHTKGKCSIKEGSYEELEVTSQMLAKSGLSVEIF